MYSQVVLALRDTVASVPGLSLQKVLLYEPNSIQNEVGAYIRLESFTKAYHAQIVAYTYRILVRVCVRYQDNQQAELTMMPFVNSVPDAIDANPYLGATVNSGGAKSEDGIAQYIQIGQVSYRCLDVYVNVLDKYETAAAIR